MSETRKLALSGRMIMLSLNTIMAPMEKHSLLVEEALEESPELLDIFRENVWKGHNLHQRWLNMPSGQFWTDIQNGRLYKEALENLP